MSLEANKAVVRRLFDEVINRGDLAVVEELLTEDVAFLGRGGKAAIRGIDAFKRVVTTLRTAFADYRFTMHDEIAEGDRVVARFTASGTHVGDYFGIAPTGKQVEYSAVDIFRLEGGKIAEVWSLSDQHDLLQQLRAVSVENRDQAKAGTDREA
jgi:steroid delta-isomerase-like uncharacterized protein